MRVEEPAHRANDGPSRGNERSERSFRVSRRTLLKAGWSVPVIMSVAPAVAFAASGTSPNTPSTPNNNSNTNTPSNNSTPGTNRNTPGPNTNSPSATPASGSPSSTSGGPGSGVGEQPSQSPQPARINRGFTG